MALSSENRSKVSAVFGGGTLGEQIVNTVDATETLAAAELGALDGVSAGTVTASKAVVVGADKNIDTIAIAASGLKIGSGAGTAVTATAAELNTVAGVTAGTVTASKALVVDANKDLGTLRHLTINGNLVTGSTTLSETELGYLDGLTPGTVASSKALVVDANKDLGAIRHLEISGNLVNGSVTISQAELQLLDGVTAGTVTASRAVTVDANKATAGLRSVVVIGGNVTLTEADSGKVYIANAADTVFTLPATVAGLRYTIVANATAVASGSGILFRPVAADKIMGNGLTSADDKDVINSTDAEGDFMEIVGDGVDGWYIVGVRGTWTREA